MNLRNFSAFCLLLLARPCWAQDDLGPAPGGFVGAASLTQVLHSLDVDSIEPVDPQLLTRYAVSGFARRLEGLHRPVAGLLMQDLRHPQDRSGLMASLAEIAKTLSPADRQICYLGAIKSALRGYNTPGTKLYGPGEYEKSLQELGFSVGGVGIYFDEDPDPQGTFKIVQMMQGFPAEKLGIASGDRLSAVNGKPLKGMQFQEVARLIRGPVGTAVDLEIRKGGVDGQTRHFSIQRAWLNPNPKGAEGKLEANGVAWVKVQYLGLRSDLDFTKLLTGLGPGTKTLVLDFRNSQGELEGAQHFLSLFLPPGRVAYQTQTRSGAEKTLTVATTAPCNLPMVVLVNQFTTDAASIVAGSLRDNGRALLVGRPTDPKQMKAFRWLAEDLPDGSTAAVTTTTFLLPLGQDLGSSGVRPDLRVAAKDAAAEVTGGPDDKAFAKALQLLQEVK
jgi:carboxyl-terminal processing protease